jgi:hypothetical protein
LQRSVEPLKEGKKGPKRVFAGKKYPQKYPQNSNGIGDVLLAMTPTLFRKHLNRLGVTQTDFARLINVNVKTVKRWASLTDPFEIPRAVEILLPLLSPTRVKALLATTEKI